MKYPMPPGASKPQKHKRSDGRTISYLDNGVSSPKTLLLHHGTPGAAGLWQNLLDDAETRGIRAIAYTKAGYPGSDKAEWSNVTEAASDFNELVDHLGVDEFVSLGWSGGGPYALASSFSAKCKGVELVAAVAPYFEMGADFLIGQAETETIEALDNWASSRENALAAAKKDMENIETEWSAETWQTGAEARPRYAQFADAYLKFNAHALPAILNSVVPDVAGYAADSYLLMNDWGFKVSEVVKPTTIWSGSLDKPCPPNHGKWLHSQISGSDWRLLDGQGHMSIMVEAQIEILQNAIAKLIS